MKLLRVLLALSLAFLPIRPVKAEPAPSDPLSLIESMEIAYADNDFRAIVGEAREFMEHGAERSQTIASVLRYVSGETEDLRDDERRAAILFYGLELLRTVYDENDRHTEASFSQMLALLDSFDREFISTHRIERAPTKNTSPWVQRGKWVALGLTAILVLILARRIKQAGSSSSHYAERLLGMKAEKISGLEATHLSQLAGQYSGTEGAKGLGKMTMRQLDDLLQKMMVGDLATSFSSGTKTRMRWYAFSRFVDDKINLVRKADSLLEKIRADILDPIERYAEEELGWTAARLGGENETILLRGVWSAPAEELDQLVTQLNLHRNILPPTSQYQRPLQELEITLKDLIFNRTSTFKSKPDILAPGLLGDLSLVTASAITTIAFTGIFIGNQEAIIDDKDLDALIEFFDLVQDPKEAKQFYADEIGFVQPEG